MTGVNVFSGSVETQLHSEP